MPDFEKDLERLLNATSQENASNTPDFILAEYLLGCLAAFNGAVKRREEWYGRGRDALTTGAAPVAYRRGPSLESLEADRLWGER